MAGSDDHLLRARVWLPGDSAPVWLERDAWPAVYRSCGLPTGTMCIAAQFQLESADATEVQQRVSAIKQAKANSQPLSAASAGCMFKNPRPEAPAGKLIDDCGLKGLREQAAVVSDQHANFIINEGGADAAMVCRLIRQVRRRVFDVTGEILELEVQTWNVPADLSRHPQDDGSDED